MYNKRKSPSVRLLITIVKILVFATLFFSLKESYVNGDLQGHILLRWTPETAEVIEDVIDTVTLNGPEVNTFESELNKAFR